VLYTNLGGLQATAARPALAEQAFRKAIELEPTSAAAQTALARFYWSQQRLDEAERAFLEAVRQQPPDASAFRALATFYIGSGRAADAEAYVVAVAQQTGTMADRLTLADFYLLTDRRAEGVALLEQIGGETGGFVEAQTRLAGLAFADGDIERAHGLVNEILARQPQNGRALFLKARFERLAGNRQEAFRLVNQAITADNSLIPAHFLLARLYAEDGDLLQATSAYRKVLQLNPFVAQAQIEVARLLLAQGARQGSDEFLEAAILMTPRDHALRVRLAKLLLEQGDIPLATAEIEELVARFPDSAVVTSLMGSLSFLKKDYRSAERWFERSFDLDRNSLDTITGLVVLDLVANRPARARGRVEDALARSPESIDILLLAAKTYASIGDLPNAEASFGRAIELDPSRLDAFTMLGQLYYDAGALDRGAAVFARIVEARPRAIFAHTMLGIIAERQGRVSEAVEHYRRALAIDRETPIAANNLAWLYAEQNRNIDEAVLLAQAAQKRLPDSPEVNDTIGWVFYRSERPDLLTLAVSYLRDAVEADGDNPVYRYHLGAAYARSGRTPQAREQLERALELNPEFQGAGDTRRLLGSLR
jgi:tetratricopeptide (TPR) repeat protein